MRIAVEDEVEALIGDRDLNLQARSRGRDVGNPAFDGIAGGRDDACPPGGAPARRCPAAGGELPAFLHAFRRPLVLHSPVRAGMTGRLTASPKRKNRLWQNQPP